jgi:SAM-dependent methyltransferase
MSRIYTCCICKSEKPADAVETAHVRSNVRAFREETFALWRCSECGSIHAADEVDLDAYYAKYPFFGRELDTFTRMGYRRLVRRLRREGMEPGQRVMDYGCGSGLLVQYLNECGYEAVGYDPYSQDHGNPAVLDATYDAVIAQDVIEHDPEPLGILATLDDLARPGGLVAIGTPNAAGIDLTQPEAFVHPLHQPYHRHIVALPALLDAGRDRGWSVERTYLTPYTNMPVISLPFLHHLMRRFDGCIDVLFERPRAGVGFWLNPKTWYYLTAGYWLCDEADIVALFRTPA